MSSTKRLRQVAQLSAIMLLQMAHLDTFSTLSAFMAEKVRPVSRRIAKVGCAGLYRQAVQHFTVAAVSAKQPYSLTITNVTDHRKRNRVMTYENIIVETRGSVGLITLNRPNALNALNSALIDDLNAALEIYEADENIGCVVLTGSEKAFAAGADIKEMQSKSYMDAYQGDFIRKWERINEFRKPVIAAVAGYALGGGCELSMMCDMIIAADTAKFGQPEIKLGVMPGAGGTQRLTRFVGKSKAMDMCLTGRMMDADEAERSGLVSRVVPAADLIDEAVKTAETIAGMSLPIVMMTKETVNRAYETTLSEGVRFERRLFHSMFATEDQKEGMSAFAEKRKAEFKNK